MFTLLDQYPIILPFAIFFGRIIDVSLGTLRIIFVSKGEKNLAPIIGFFEVLIWIVIISEVFSRANNYVAYLSYAGGYATGNYVGILIEKRIAFGYVLLRIYTRKKGEELLQLLNKNNLGATLTRASGSAGEIDLVETVINRKTIGLTEKLINEFDPDVFYVAEDVRARHRGIFPQSRSLINFKRLGK